MRQTLTSQSFPLEPSALCPLPFAITNGVYANWIIQVNGCGQGEFIELGVLWQQVMIKPAPASHFVLSATNQSQDKFVFCSLS